MVMRRMFDLVCDLCNSERDNPGWYASEVREGAQSEGWRRRKGKDVCPNCLTGG